MGFWTGVKDYFGFEPVDDAGDFFKNVLRGVMMPSNLGKAWADGPGGYTGGDAMRDLFAGGGFLGAGLKGAIQDHVSDHWSDDIPSTMGGVTDTIDSLRENGLSDYIGNLFQTDADAALDQANVNDFLSQAAWQRSEESADRAQARARELRQTYYADLMKGLKDAGLNPVLAASGGFGGVSSSAPQGTSQAATSSKADGLNLVNVLQALASILSGAGSLIGGLNPLKAITSIDSNGSLSKAMYSYGRR